MTQTAVEGKVREWESHGKSSFRDSTHEEQVRRRGDLAEFFFEKLQEAGASSMVVITGDPTHHQLMMQHVSTADIKRAIIALLDSLVSDNKLMGLLVAAEILQMLKTTLISEEDV